MERFSMNDTVKQWVEKAERDYLTAQRELSATDKPNYDAVCFHAQQCIEKLIKGLLIQLGIVPPKTHGLVFLSSLLAPVCSDWSAEPEDLRFLTRAAVDFRYPGESADEETAKEALAICTQLRASLVYCLAAEHPKSYRVKGYPEMFRLALYFLLPVFRVSAVKSHFFGFRISIFGFFFLRLHFPKSLLFLRRFPLSQYHQSAPEINHLCLNE
jgi:HEPN domain-containing protein